MTKKIPVTVLTGFLGSGKTTLLNRILSEQHGLKIAVIENEFGEIGIDQDLVINADEEVFEMNNGCICCTVRGDLVRILGDLATRKEKFDRVILETTGLADPGPVAQTFFVDDVSRQHYELDGIVTLVDAKHVGQHLDDSDEVLAQIAFADRIVLNKIDLISDSEKAAISQRLRAINGMADIYPAVMGDTLIDRLLDIGGFNLERVLEEKPNFLEPEYPFEWAGIFELKPGKHQLVLKPGPDPEMSVLLCDVNAENFEKNGAETESSATLEAGLKSLAEQVFQYFSEPAEGLTSGQALLQSNHHYCLSLTGGVSFTFDIDAPVKNRLAIFSQHTPEEFSMVLSRDHEVDVEPCAQHYFNAQHEHDSKVTSVAVELPGLFDGQKINAWLNVFLRIQGENIFRMKGVVGVEGEATRFVFQGVHMMFGAQPGKPWGDELPMNRIVFIGRDLSEDYIQESLRKCLA
ncbi:MAG TPA: cobalamin biosynthesis protein CobW [Gammaproteobacteria bacterium]|nr:cobalamin biosynthesis protein CobW [Gammaproteobacteria bacterium]